ncbi:hypothetical protein HWV62_9597 [Athelia sp. TMB]|nr:hypothetical protein HWV62_9597 [Athelia sp. TMB]
MLRLLLSACVFYLAANLVCAAPSNITDPPSSLVNSTSSPPSSSLAHIAFTSPTCRDIDGCRTLLNIISSCLSTIFICVWVAVHPDVRSPKDGWGAQLTERIMELCGTFLVPEGALGIAVFQYREARKLVKSLEHERLELRERLAATSFNGPNSIPAASDASLASQTKRKLSSSYHSDEDTIHYRGEDEVSIHSEEETLIHGESSFAKVGEIDSDGRNLYTNNNATKRMKELDRPWTMPHAFFVLADGFYFFDENDEPDGSVSANDAVRMVRDGMLVPPPLSELKDRSKGDGLSKALAILQTLWFVIQCTARRLEHLPMTQLEIMTLAYSTMTVAIYIFWWHKPLNVTCPIRVPAPKEKSSDGPELFKEGSGVSLLVTSFTGILIFGGIHLAAWFYQFPTVAEKMLWRVSALIITAAPFVGLLMTWIGDVYEEEIDNWPELLSASYYIFLIILTIPVYIAARLLLFSLSFSTLRMVPAEVYHTVTWTQLIPHI